MTRPAAIAFVLAAAIPSVASAGTYVGLGIGTAVGGSWDVQGTEGDVDGFARSGRLMVGKQFGRLAIEGQGSRFKLQLASDAELGSGAEFQGTQVGVALKFNLPLGNNFEVFGKGGVARMWLTSSQNVQEMSGNGWLLAAGVEYRLPLKVTSASVFMDYQQSSTSFDVSNGHMDVPFGTSMGMWTVGATVSF